MRILAIVALAGLTGCVERVLMVRSDPPGAEVMVDGDPAGKTPCEVPFVWYGTREVRVRQTGYLPVRERVSCSTPWYQIFPLDFVTDVIIPFRIRDEHPYEVRLAPENMKDEMPAMKERAEELRRKALEDSSHP